jgi:predicted ArsR family transcriptional regulator
MDSNELKTKLKTLTSQQKDVFKALSTKVPHTVREIANTLGDKEYNVRRILWKLVAKNLSYEANENENPRLYLANNCTEPNNIGNTLMVTPELATCLITLKEECHKRLPEQYARIVSQGVYEIAENVGLKANQIDTHQQQWRLEQVTNHLGQYGEPSNAGYYDDLVENIEKAILIDRDLVLEIHDYQEPVALKPIKLKVVESKLWLIASTLDDPDKIKYINVEDIMGTHFEDESAQQENKLRWAA